MWSGLYNALLAAAAILAVPYYGVKMAVTGKYRKSLGPKLGRRLPETASLEGSPRIWVHAVSVGEVTAAAPVVTALRGRFPGACIVLSTSTETGQEMARNLVPAASAHIYYPLDIPGVVRKVIARMNPGYLRPPRDRALAQFHQDLPGAGDADRHGERPDLPPLLRPVPRDEVLLEGAPGRRCRGRCHLRGRCGAARRDRHARRPDPCPGERQVRRPCRRVSPAIEREIADSLGIEPGQEVLVAGSTHEGEEAVILEVYRRLLETRPGFKLILVPRHIERGEAVAEMVRQAGFADCITISEIRAGRRRRGERVILVDVIGELFKVYSLATVVFCGGSLVPKGGQNILEAAAWGKVVFYGPHMEDFRDERALLEEAGAGIAVRTGRNFSRGSGISSKTPTSSGEGERRGGGPWRRTRVPPCGMPTSSRRSCRAQQNPG